MELFSGLPGGIPTASERETLMHDSSDKKLVQRDMPLQMVVSGPQKHDILACLGHRGTHPRSIDSWLDYMLSSNIVTSAKILTLRAPQATQTHCSQKFLTGIV